MDPRKLVLVAAACLAACLPRTAADDSTTQKSIVTALADADRYAGGFTDAHVADAWERSADGWVRGGYTLVSGDVRTTVRYVVDPSGEMRVMARRPGPTPPGAGPTLGAAAVSVHHRLGSPLLGGYRPPFYQRLVHFGGLSAALDDGFDDHDVDFDDDDSVDDDDPFFLDDNWNAAASPVDAWARLTRPVDGVGAVPLAGPLAGPAATGCKSTKCRTSHRGAPAPGTPAGTSGGSGSASFRSGHYDMVLKTSPAVGSPAQ